MTSLKAVWESMRQSTGGSGWKALAIDARAPCVLMAGVKHPEVIEGLLLEVPAKSILASADYPEARGFEVKVEPIAAGMNGKVRLSLRRTSEGSLELFTAVAEDISGRVASQNSIDSAVSAFFSRIRTWQTFMQEHDGQRLSEAEEVGLVGELLFLKNVLFERMDVSSALRSWQGPLGGLQDFQYKNHGVELKTTTSSNKNIVRITSLAQLDEQPLKSLHLVMIRLALGEAGFTLPELIQQINAQLEEHDMASPEQFQERLLGLGYLDMHKESYRRRFTLGGFDSYKVDGQFPKLTAASVPAGILSATYDIDLRTAEPFRVETHVMLSQFLEADVGT